MVPLRGLEAIRRLNIDQRAAAEYHSKTEGKFSTL